MPSKKQQRRRAKSKRHDYETVYVDEEGNEVEADAAEALTATKPSAKRDQRGSARSARVVQPPSWGRALRRAALMAPLMFIVIMLLEKDSAVGARLSIAVFYSVLFVPFMYLMDSVAYRTYRKRLERSQPPR